MIKKLGIILSATALVLVFSGCNQKNNDEYVKISNPANDFSYEISADWTETSEKGMLSATVLGDISGANIIGYSFRHELEEDPSSFDYWNNYYKKQLEETFKNVSIESEDEIAFNEAKQDADKQMVTRATYKVTIGEENFDCDIMLAVYNGKVYTLTLTQGAKTEYIKDSYTDYSKEFEKIVKTFKIG